MTRLIEQMTKEELVELIGKCWMTHDGMWFAHSLMEHGIETTNRLNKAAIRALADIEIKRFLRLLTVSPDQLTSLETIKNFFSAAADLLIPRFMNVDIAFEDPNRITWKFTDRQCFAYTGIKMLQVENEYECGPLYRIQCWLKSLGIGYEMDPPVDKCMMPKQGGCSGTFRLILPG